jgi:hypothetical protein
VAQTGPFSIHRSTGPQGVRVLVSTRTTAWTGAGPAAWCPPGGQPPPSAPETDGVSHGAQAPQPLGLGFCCPPLMRLGGGPPGAVTARPPPPVLGRRRRAAGSAHRRTRGCAESGRPLPVRSGGGIAIVCVVSAAGGSRAASDGHEERGRGPPGWAGRSAPPGNGPVPGGGIDGGAEWWLAPGERKRRRPGGRGYGGASNGGRGAQT